MKFIVVVGLIFAIVSVGASAQERISIQGTGISLINPEGFVVAQQFLGVQQESTGSSIMVTKMPVSFSELAEGLADPANLRSKGMEFLSQETINIDDKEGVLLHVAQNAYGVDFLKWMMVMGDEQQSVMIVATFPAQLKNDLSDMLKETVLSAQFGESTSVDPTEVSGFVIEETEIMKLAQSMGKYLMYTRNGEFPVKSVDDPLFIAGPAISNLEIDDKADFAKARILQTASLKDIWINGVPQSVVIDGLEGFAIIADAKDERSEEDVVVYQVLLFVDKTYYVMTGIISKSMADKHLDEFKVMAASFKRR